MHEGVDGCGLVPCTACSASTIGGRLASASQSRKRRLRFDGIQCQCLKLGLDMRTNRARLGELCLGPKSFGGVPVPDDIQKGHTEVKIGVDGAESQGYDLEGTILLQRRAQRPS